MRGALREGESKGRMEKKEGGRKGEKGHCTVRCAVELPPLGAR